MFKGLPAGLNPALLLAVGMLMSPTLTSVPASALAVAEASAPAQAVGINLMDIVRALIRKGPGKGQEVSKGIKLVDPSTSRRAIVRVVDEPDAGIVMLVSLAATGRDLMAHTARLIPEPAGTSTEAGLPRPPIRDLRILRLEMPKSSGEQEVVVILLDPETLDALADSAPGSRLELAGWDETLRLELSQKALRDLSRFRDRIGSGRIG